MKVGKTNDDKIGIWAVRAQSKILAKRLSKELHGRIYLSESAGKLTNRQAFARSYHQCRRWVMIGTTGIAVRYLQGLTSDKKTDPAVVVVDEAGRFAISLIGGHEGGANRLAYRVANILGGSPVITTATEALKPLVVGIGCRKNISVLAINQAVQSALASISRDEEEIREVATIDLKATEPGLLAWCEKRNLPLRVIPRELIMARPWVTEPSAWVKENVGVDGVCEPCALLATYRGKLIVRKTNLNGVTVAMVEEGPCR